MTDNNSLAPSISTSSEAASLLERVARILESGRGRVLRTINQETVMTYWLIGREIVKALQGGETRAQYGNGLIADLSRCLSEGYGAGFSAVNLKDFRQFFLTYADRSVSICQPSGGDSTVPKGFSLINRCRVSTYEIDHGGF